MVARLNIVFATLVAATGTCLAASERGATTLRSQRRHVSVVVTTPAGWYGPAYQAWPSCDSFSFSHGAEPAACYLQVRFDPYTDKPGDRHSAEDIVIHWNSTPLADIRAQLRREFQNPQVERIGTLRLAGEPVRVYAAYNADGNWYAAEIMRAGTVISFELRCPSRGELQRHRSAFLSFLRSLRIT